MAKIITTTPLDDYILECEQEEDIVNLLEERSAFREYTREEIAEMQNHHELSNNNADNEEPQEEEEEEESSDDEDARTVEDSAVLSLRQLILESDTGDEINGVMEEIPEFQKYYIPNAYYTEPAFIVPYDVFNRLTNITRKEIRKITDRLDNFYGDISIKDNIVTIYNSY